METQYCTYIFETKGYGLMDGKTRGKKSRDTIPLLTYMYVEHSSFKAKYPSNKCVVQFSL